MARHEPRVQSIKREKKNLIWERYLPKSDFLETLEKGGGGEERILRRFLEFHQSEVVEPRVKVLRLDKSYS